MIHKKIDIWENKTYNGLSSKDNMPYLHTYILEGDTKRPCVLISPGGGYSFVSEREAEPIAMQFLKEGFNAFILYYSVAPNIYPQALLDIALAMSIIRSNSKEWNVKEDSIYACGFSAGGHLTASLGVNWNKPLLRDSLKLDSSYFKPNGLILCYPVIVSGEYSHKGSINNLLGKTTSDTLLTDVSLEKQVSSDTPPTFIWHTVEDSSVPVENSLEFVKSLRTHNIPFEMHIYPYGRHGLSLANKETGDPEFNHVSGWMDLCTKWINEVMED